jgi:predicted nucleic acid-binding protein
MRYLLDTCLVSELIRKDPNIGVVNWIKAKEETSLYLSVLTFGEIRKGISKLKDSRKRKELGIWFEELESRFKDRIIPIDIEISIKWGEIQANLESSGKSMPTIDALIACTALTKKLIIVTRNGKDMRRSHAEILDPWE